MEDEDSKVRRNLLAVSTLVLLVAWLDTPLSKVGGKFLGIENLDAQFEWRVWAAAGALIIYFALRHRFSPENTTAFNAMKKEMAGAARRVLTLWMIMEVRLFKLFRLTLFLPKASLVAADDSALASGTKHGLDGPKVARIRVDGANFLINDKGPNNVSLSTLFHLVDGGSKNTVVPEQLQAPLAHYHVLFLRFWAFLWLAMYSKASTSFLWPWSLAAAAAAVVTFKLVTTSLASPP